MIDITSVDFTQADVQEDNQIYPTIRYHFRNEYIISPETTTKKGGALYPCSQSISLPSIERMCPRSAMRLTCADVNFGNIFSVLDLVSGSPLRVLDIVVIYSVVATHKIIA